MTKHEIKARVESLKSYREKVLLLILLCFEDDNDDRLCDLYERIDAVLE